MGSDCMASEGSAPLTVVQNSTPAPHCSGFGGVPGLAFSAFVLRFDTDPSTQLIASTPITIGLVDMPASRAYCCAMSAACAATAAFMGFFVVVNPLVSFPRSSRPTDTSSEMVSAGCNVNSDYSSPMSGEYSHTHPGRYACSLKRNGIGAWRALTRLSTFVACT